MTGGWIRPIPATVFGTTVALELAAIALSWGLEPVYDTLLYAVYTVVMAGAGALIASRVPGNAIGWLLCGFALLNALAADFAQGYGLRAAAEHWPGGAIAEWIALNSWLPSGFGWIMTFLLFPDGRLPDRRWRPLPWRAVPWVGAIGTVLAMAGWSLDPAIGRSFVGGHNPLAVPGAPTGALLGVGMTIFVAALVASAGSLVWRLRRAHGVQRQQLKWFALAAAVATVALPLAFALWYVTPAAGVIASVALTALPVAAVVAILRYRLYDIDVLISATASITVMAL